MRQGDVRRVSYGHFVRPPSETETGKARIEPVLGYVIAAPSGPILFDTGLGTADPETEAHYRPKRRNVADALAEVGVDVAAVRRVVNCHLHFDHCGGNDRFPGRPVVVQRTELRNARQPDYTVPSAIDFDGAIYEEIDGEAELAPGIWIVPTPGHTTGHQSLVVRCDDGTVVCAGQATNFADELGTHVLGRRAHGTAPEELSPIPPWVDRLLAFDPRRIVFAHDLSVLEP
jgi:N-acyl homoserine lactone hydrolase